MFGNDVTCCNRMGCAGNYSFLVACLRTLCAIADV